VCSLKYLHDAEFNAIQRHWRRNEMIKIEVEN